LWFFVHHARHVGDRDKATDVQLQESEVGVAVVRLTLALLHDIVLEDTRCLWVVSIEAIEDLLDVIRPLGREVVWCSHDVWWTRGVSRVLKALSI
jgi:hypothetical protein